MNNKPEYKLRELQENVKYYFKFLLERGFRIISIIFVDKAMEHWAIIMVNNECLIKIYNHQEEVMLAISTLELYNEMGFFDLEELAYLASNGEPPSTGYQTGMMEEDRQFERLGALLKEYLDKIVFLPGENFYGNDGKDLNKTLLQIRSTVNKNKQEKVWFYFQDLLHQS